MRRPHKMTPETKCKSEGDAKYQAEILRDLRHVVRSIDSKVEDILEELKGHPLPDNGNGFVPPELYDDEYES